MNLLYLAPDKYPPYYNFKKQNIFNNKNWTENPVWKLNQIENKIKVKNKTKTNYYDWHQGGKV